MTVPTSRPPGLGPRRIAEFFALMAGIAIVIAGLRASWIAATVIMFLSGVLMVFCDSLLDRKRDSAPSARWELLERCMYFLIGGAFGVVLGATMMVTLIVWGHPNWDLARPLLVTSMTTGAIMGFAIPRALAWSRRVLEVVGALVGSLGG